MQVQMQVFAKRTQSLRTIVVDDLRRGKHPKLWVQAAKNPKRRPGWAKIYATDCVGAINLEWDGSQQMLTARAITRGGNRPMPLLGTFISYLLEKHNHKIAAVNVQLRK